jgi:hypothetical protein
MVETGTASGIAGIAGSRTPVDSKLGELEGSTSEVGATVSFPSDLGLRNDHWVAFRVQEKRKFQRRDSEIHSDWKTVFLPMPSSLPTTYAQSYQTDSLGIAGRLAANFASSDTPLGDLTDTKLTDMMDAGNALALSLGTSSAGSALGLLATLKGKGAKTSDRTTALKGVAGVTTASLAQKVIKGAMVGAGSALNPHMAQVYNGPSGMRTHQFQYKLVPKTPEESEILREIIHVFKYYSAPHLSGSHFFDYPQQWDIDFRFPKYLFKIGQSVLTSFGVEYHGEGLPVYFERGDDQPAPVSVVINMTFAETSITTKQNILKDWRAGGR